MPSSGPEFAPVDGINVPQQAGGAALILLDQITELAEQHVITQSIERRIRDHHSCVSRGFRALSAPKYEVGPTCVIPPRSRRRSRAIELNSTETLQPLV